MNKLELTSRPHPARRARRVVGVTSLATTVGIIGGIAASQRSSSADEVVAVEPQQSTLSTLTQTATTVLPTTVATPVPTTATPTTTTTTINRPGDNPFGENGALGAIDDIVTPTTTTTTTTAAPRPAKKTPPPTNPPAPPTTVSNGS